jgi:hypothetical protein
MGDLLQHVVENTVTPETKNHFGFQSPAVWLLVQIEGWICRVLHGTRDTLG